MSEIAGIEAAHRAALAPTSGEHEVEVPDPYCFGDDSCVCIQLKAAREDERNLMIAKELTRLGQEMEKP